MAYQILMVLFVECIRESIARFTFCTLQDSTPVFSSPQLDAPVSHVLAKDTCFLGEMHEGWVRALDLQEGYLYSPALYKPHVTDGLKAIKSHGLKTRSRILKEESLHAFQNKRRGLTRRQEGQRMLLVDGAWGQWTRWSVCNCNSTQTRVRKCDSPAPVGSGQKCPGLAQDITSCTLDTQTLWPVDGQWGSWYPWSQCSTTCGIGTIFRVRSCNNPRPQNGGLYCEGSEEYRSGCQGPPCPDWSHWFNGHCSLTCGNGSQTRVRHCSTGHAEDCAGNSSDVVACQKSPCKVDGSWSSWSPWSQCDVTCEDGHIHRTRTCTNPAPAFGGLNCSGANQETSTCKLATCPAWSPWFNGHCSVTCGIGTQTRIRHCSTGHAEDCTGNGSAVVDCQNLPCEVHGSWSSWSTWSQCDVTCEDGHIHRTRTCTNPAPAFGGQNCSGVNQETNTCTLAKCPNWSEWFLGDCSVTCGDGTLSRMRMCSSGHDEDCPGSAFDTVPCSRPTC